jgi:glycogen synthase
MQNGMRQDFSWKHSAGQYLALYNQVLGGQIPPGKTHDPGQYGA